VFFAKSANEAAMSGIGLMEGAYFVGRKEIIDWVNSTLDLQLQKVEETASGAVSCQLLDIMYPGQVPMHKVNWAAKQNFEFVANYKILQTAFTKLHIDRHIDVDRLISGRYMDNLEFMQWFKRFFELSVQTRGDYDCAAQRARGKGGAAFGGGGGGGGATAGAAAAAKPTAISKPSSAPAAAKPTTRSPSSPGQTTRPAATAAASSAAPPAAAKKATASTAASKVNLKENKAPPDASSAAPRKTTSSYSNSAALTAEVEALRQTNEESSRAYSELRLEMDGLEKERDFYFDKLRDIELLLQDLEDNGKGNEMSAAIFKILYATAEGFEQTEAALIASQVETKAADAPAETSVPVVEEETF